MKRILLFLYPLIIVCIAAATIIEKNLGTEFVGQHIYGAWWFTALWAVMTVVGFAYMMQQKLYKRLAVMLLHMAFVVILIGALVTHLTARRDTIHLRMNVPGQLTSSTMLTLKSFRIVNYPGTDAPLDYQSVIDCGAKEVTVSMNHIGNIDGYRLFQSSYDSDGEGVTLGVSYDPYGIAITYCGYLLLLIGIIATLFSRGTRMRALYRKSIACVALLLVTMSVSAEEPLPVVDRDIAQRMGTIQVLYNNRICPMNTVATDFVTKLTGRASWNGYTADQVFTSWMIYYMPWEAAMKPYLHPDKQSLSVKETKKLAERQAVVEMFYSGEFIKMFPYRIGHDVNWYMPGAHALPREIPVKEQFFIKQSMDFLTEAIVTGQHDRAVEIIAKIKLFQREMVGDVLPSSGKTRSELFYNSLRAQKWPIMLSLTLSLLLCMAMLFTTKLRRSVNIALWTLHVALLIYLTLQLSLRWWLSGHVPVSNGPETMLFMAWVVLLFSVMLHRQFAIIMGFAPLIASFCMLVAMMGGSSTQLTPLMPVLQSPLLSIHVMTVMCAYAIFALQVLLGVYAFWARDLERITALSQLLLYPAVFLLTIGIFLGAVWANVSWGNYWSWDPKESWALITLMVYAVPMHKASLPLFRNDKYYHIYIVGAFLAVLITYFGVNYLLGGMHSYA